MIALFANGQMPADRLPEWFLPHLEQVRLLIAADAGARHLLAAGRLPHLVVGDFDSLPSTLWLDLAGSGVEFVRHPADKDETDLELALAVALERRETADEGILIFAALGGRLDQTLANVLLLAHPAWQGVPIRLVEPEQQAWLVRGRTEIRGKVGDTVSLIPLGGEAHVASSEGLAWPLHQETLLLGPSRGVSNRMTLPVATLTVDAGMVLCVHTFA